MYKLVLLRHGESLWNKENRFTGWEDVDLSELGRQEASEAGRTLKQLGYDFDLSYCSVLKRAIRTLWLALDEMDRLWLPVHKDWRLNERHYGALTGLNKSETAARHGEEQVKIWRRSYDVPPPMMELGDQRHPSHDPRYRNVPSSSLPAGESLAMTVSRVQPFWLEELAPAIRGGKKVLVAAHGNSIRALVQILENLTQAEIMEVNIPTGIPLLYELDKNMKFVSKKYLGDPSQVQAAIDRVAGQGRAAKA